MSEQGSDIFISYSSKDHAWVSGLAQALVACGYRVWWDRHLLAGENFHKEIERALNAARCVVTVWSEHSIESKWVVAESGQGDKRGVLIPLVYRPANIPLAFQTYHNADFQQWRGGVDEDCFQSVLRSIERVLKRPVMDTSRIQGQNFMQKPPVSGEQRNYRGYLILAGVILCLAVIVALAFQGKQSPERDSSIKPTGDFKIEASGDSKVNVITGDDQVQQGE